VGCLVVLADVGLDLDDPAFATAGSVGPNETRAEEGTRGGEGVLGEQVAIEDLAVRLCWSRTGPTTGRGP
jgi:hypothetical protein